MVYITRAISNNSQKGSGGEGGELVNIYQIYEKNHGFVRILWYNLL